MRRQPFALTQGLLFTCLAILATTSSCTMFGLSAEDQQALEAHQRRAKIFYEGGDLKSLTQARQQAKMGLSIDPDDYALRWIEAMVYLRTAKADPRNLDEARKRFDSLWRERDISNHHPNFVLGYGWLQHELGKREFREAQALERRVKEGLPAIDANVAESKKREHESQGKAMLLQARKTLEWLVDQGDEPLYAQQRLLRVYANLDEYDRAVELGTKFFKTADRLEKAEKALMTRVLDVTTEQQHRKIVREIRERRLETRMMLTSLHFNRQHYDRAAAEFDKLVEAQPNVAAHYYGRGEALWRLGQQERARQDFRAFLVKTTLPEGNDRVKRAREAIRDNHP